MPWAYKIYDVLVNALFIPFFPLFLVYSLVTGKYRRGLWQRLGFYPASLKEKLQLSPRRLWIHAVSVGEVRGAEAVSCLETELWPGFIYRAHRRGSKIILVNGRISTRSFARYQKIRSFMRPT